MKENKKILIIGGAGYIGSVLARFLLENNYYVIILDNLVFGSSSLSEILSNKRMQLIKGDVRHIEDLVTAMKGVDIVINLAALVGDKMCSLDNESAITVNYESTKIVLEICKFCNIKRFLFASTCSVYGKTDNLICSEDSALSPLSLYAETKAKSEEIILSSEVPSTIFRLATVYGASYRMRFDLVVNILVAHALKEGRIKIFGGNQWRPLVHVSDVARAFMLCIESDKNKIDHKIFNLGSDEQNYQVWQLGKIIKNCIPDLEIEQIVDAEDRRDYKVSFSRIADILGFKPVMTVEKAVHEIKNLFDRGIVKDYKDQYHYNVEYKYKY